MSWEKQKRLSNRQVTGVRFSTEASKYPRTKIRLGHDVLAYLGVGHGDFVDVLYDHSNRKIGFQKGSPKSGFQLTGKHCSMTLSFATPKNKHLDLLLSAYGEDLEFTGEGDIAVVKIKATNRPVR